MPRPNPETPDSDRYECIDCSNQLPREPDDGRCPDCGGPLRNIGTPSER